VSLAPRHRQPDYIVAVPGTLGTGTIAAVLSIVVQSADANAVPSAATYQLIDPTGEVYYAALGIESPTIAADGTVSVTIAVSMAAAVAYSDDYTSRWSLTIDGVVYVFEREALLVRTLPYCPVAVADLQRRMSELIDTSYVLPAGRSTLQSYIDEAWDQTIARALSAGVHVHLIASWYAWREYVARVAELVIARDFMTSRPESRWSTLWEVLGGPADDPRSAEWAWAKLTYRVDRDQDGGPDDIESRPGVDREDPSAPAWRGW